MEAALVRYEVDHVGVLLPGKQIDLPGTGLSALPLGTDLRQPDGPHDAIAELPGGRVEMAPLQPDHPEHEFRTDRVKRIVVRLRRFRQDEPTIAVEEIARVAFKLKRPSERSDQRRMDRLGRDRSGTLPFDEHRAADCRHAVDLDLAPDGLMEMAHFCLRALE